MGKSFDRFINSLLGEMPASLQMGCWIGSNKSFHKSLRSRKIKIILWHFRLPTLSRASASPRPKLSEKRSIIKFYLLAASAAEKKTERATKKALQPTINNKTNCLFIRNYSFLFPLHRPLHTLTTHKATQTNSNSQWHEIRTVLRARHTLRARHLTSTRDFPPTKSS